ncbi:calcium-binding and coiled-coil domain-containing protein 1-like [Macrobrachium rosenbergii]|uniref:calcium-binding and coiled-coil domain-containing protein 1-like n=1 Tax=Macrobrachium rosenbergii TaxID=79674 RepID=UPI0034D717E0
MVPMSSVHEAALKEMALCLRQKSSLETISRKERNEGRTEYSEVLQEIRRLREGQEDLQKEIRKEHERNQKMEQLLQNLLKKVEEKPSDQHTREFAKADDRTKEAEVMSGRRDGKERKTPLARRLRPKRWKPNEMSLWSSVLKFAAQKHKKKEEGVGPPSELLRGHAEDRAVRGAPTGQDAENLHLRNRISVARVRNELLQEQLEAQKAENKQLRNRITQMEGGLKVDNECVENLRRQLGKANCIVEQKIKEADS